MQRLGGGGGGGSGEAWLGLRLLTLDWPNVRERKVDRGCQVFHEWHVAILQDGLAGGQSIAGRQLGAAGSCLT